MKRPENKKMEKFLLDNGIKAKAKYWWKGSMKRTWTLYGKGQKLTREIRENLTALGFLDFDGKPLSDLSGNPWNARDGGDFHVSVIGHDEMTEGITPGSN